MKQLIYMLDGSSILPRSTIEGLIGFDRMIDRLWTRRPGNVVKLDQTKNANSIMAKVTNFVKGLFGGFAAPELAFA